MNDPRHVCNRSSRYSLQLYFYCLIAWCIICILFHLVVHFPIFFTYSSHNQFTSPSSLDVTKHWRLTYFCSLPDLQKHYKLQYQLFVAMCAHPSIVCCSTGALGGWRYIKGLRKTSCFAFYFQSCGVFSTSVIIWRYFVFVCVTFDCLVSFKYL